METTLTTNQMLKRLVFSKNKGVAVMAACILDGTLTVKKELTRNHSRFFTAVLKGDYQEAMESADGANKEALLKEIQSLSNT